MSRLTAEQRKPEEDLIVPSPQGGRESSYQAIVLEDSHERTEARLQNRAMSAGQKLCSQALMYLAGQSINNKVQNHVGDTQKTMRAVTYCGEVILQMSCIFFLNIEWECSVGLFNCNNAENYSCRNQ